MDSLKSLVDIFDPEKIKAIAEFSRGGGTQKTHKGQQSHAHSGTRVYHRKGERWNDYWYFDRDEPKRFTRRRINRRGGDITEE